MQQMRQGASRRTEVLRQLRRAGGGVRFGAAPAALFDVKPAVLALPERARLFQSHPCDGCGEVTAEHLLRLENGKKLCLDCFRAYNRFDV